MKRRDFLKGLGLAATLPVATKVEALSLQRKALLIKKEKEKEKPKKQTRTKVAEGLAPTKEKGCTISFDSTGIFSLKDSVGGAL